MLPQEPNLCYRRCNGTLSENGFAWKLHSSHNSKYMRSVESGALTFLVLQNFSRSQDFSSEKKTILIAIHCMKPLTRTSKSLAYTNLGKKEEHCLKAL